VDLQEGKGGSPRACTANERLVHGGERVGMPLLLVCRYSIRLQYATTPLGGRFWTPAGGARTNSPGTLPGSLWLLGDARRPPDVRGSDRWRSCQCHSAASVPLQILVRLLHFWFRYSRTPLIKSSAGSSPASRRLIPGGWPGRARVRSSPTPARHGPLGVQRRARSG